MNAAMIQSENCMSGPRVKSTQECPDAGRARRMLDAAVDNLNEYFAALEERCEAPGCDLNVLAGGLAEQLRRVKEFCRVIEKVMDGRTLRKIQREFRRRTDHYFSKSSLMNQARTWPRGYPGDYRIIDATYDNRPLSEGIGELMDGYFLATTLARGIRHRREKMRDMLTEELLRRPGAQVLNIGCGPCREVLELAPVIKRCNAHITNVDFDADALRFSGERLNEVGIADHVSFRRYNAIRMVNAQKNVREFGQFDVIYTIGLLDYLSDAILVRLIKSLHTTLKPNGVLIAVFKDRDQYATQDYHWLVDWSQFHQRDARASRTCFDEAGIASDAISVSRTSDNVMIFYRVLQTADTKVRTLTHGSHGRGRPVGRYDVRTSSHDQRSGAARSSSSAIRHPSGRTRG
ncbi:MAG: class I SAM-dependent methyltransferase [Planctomycetes bacterium]|nr:class I SAM-dependent methyltransferase [Planctomycetota bacterium]MBL7044468.1 class I SAM-dependent methyltransferase [Pirellulaceae bacterium]